MNKQPLILALTDASDPQSDPQLRMLANVPHIVANSREALSGSTADAEVILHWGGSPDLLKAAFLAGRNVRWIHSRSAGLDRILFPELVQSPIPLTNGSGVFSLALGTV